MTAQSNRPLDLVVRGGKLVTAGGVYAADIGVRDGRIAVIGSSLSGAVRVVDASGRYVLPGGVDAHCHVEQESSLGGVWTADDFDSATLSAAFGGTTTIVPFAVQRRGQSIRQVVAATRDLGDAKARIDYSLHLILTDPQPDILKVELPEVVEAGICSIKVYLAYERMRVTDQEFLTVLSACRDFGAIPMVHAENWDIIRWASDQLTATGRSAPRFHPFSHPIEAEADGICGATRLAALVDVPLVILHLSSSAGLEEVKAARRRGARVVAETCPHYLLLTSEVLSEKGVAAAKFVCSPPLRSVDDQVALWSGLADGSIDLVSSDHCPYRFDASGKLVRGPDPTFKDVPNGLPGIETRLPVVWSAGVASGRLSPQRFVELMSTNPAKVSGIYPRKGTIEIGSDADLVVWDAERRVRIEATLLHDRAGYTPFEGTEVNGWPTDVIQRGNLIVTDGEYVGVKGAATFVPAIAGRGARSFGWDVVPGEVLL